MVKITYTSRNMYSDIVAGKTNALIISKDKDVRPGDTLVIHCVSDDNEEPMFVMRRVETVYNNIAAITDGALVCFSRATCSKCIDHCLKTHDEEVLRIIDRILNLARSRNEYRNAAEDAGIIQKHPEAKTKHE